MKKAERWQTINTIREFIAAVESDSIQKGSLEKIQQWLEWSKKKADWYDPFIEAADELLEGVDRTALTFFREG